MRLLISNTRLRKYSIIAIVLLVVLSAYGRNRPDSEEPFSYSFLRSSAATASEACQQYFDSITEFAESRASESAIEQLTFSLNRLTNELVDVNSAVGFAVTNETTRFANLQMVETIKNSATEIKAEAFLTTTVKTECEKWRRFSSFSIEQVELYVKRDFSTLVQETSSLLCSSAKSELKLIDTKKIYSVVQCGAKEYEGELALLIVLSDWLKSDWVKTMDIQSAPSREELDVWLFDIPLHVLSQSLANSGIEPINFDSIVIAFEDDGRTVYEMRPDDVSLALQAPTVKETVSILREKISTSDS